MIVSFTFKIVNFLICYVKCYYVIYHKYLTEVVFKRRELITFGIALSLVSEDIHRHRKTTICSPCNLFIFYLKKNSFKIVQHSVFVWIYDTDKRAGA